MSETMRREILGQPELLADILPGLRRRVADLPLPNGASVWAAGCGDSAFAAAAMAGWFRSCDVPYRSATAHDLAFHSPVGRGDIVVLMSISGGTRRTVQAAGRVKENGAPTIAITCNPESALAQACDHVLPLGFQPISRRTPHTADYLATLLALAMLGETWGGRPADQLNGVPGAIEETIAATKDTAMAFGADLHESGKLFVLGQGGNRATADYIAAKYHESGGLPALSAETENFVHGMNFMVDPDDSVLILGGDGDGASRADELAATMGRLCRSVALARADGAAAAQSTPLAGATIGPALSPFVLTTIGQLVCLGTVTARGLPVEETRAGRGDAATHGDVQSLWMTTTRID